MPRQSWLPTGGANLFQGIKAKKEEAKAKGIELIDLSIGQPQGPALYSARLGASRVIMSPEETAHEYQDNGSPGVPDFAFRFVRAHVERSLFGTDVDYLPIPGIKPMLGLIPLACGSHTRRDVYVATTTQPGYPTPRDWAKTYLGLNVVEPTLSPENGFRFGPADLGPYVTLVMTNYPHNPSGAVATREWWEEICAFCESRGTRIFNDAAYIALRRWNADYARYHNQEESCCLADVAVDFPNLSWAEAYSASKLIGNGTGWRIGAMVGSPDFIADIKTIKGNTDSGFAAPMAAGVLAAVETDGENLEGIRRSYSSRLDSLIAAIKTQGMILAVEPGAGFFTLWQAPKQAFGIQVDNAVNFNDLMIERTGLVGVPFDPYIRYSVAREFSAEAVGEAFKNAAVGYKEIAKEGVVS